MIETTYSIRYEDPDDPSKMHTAALRFDADAAIQALYDLREQYPRVVFHLEPKPNDQCCTECGRLRGTNHLTACPYEGGPVDYKDTMQFINDRKKQEASQE